MIANSPAAWSERASAENSWNAALWSEAGQRARFDSVLAALDPQPGESLLDYGCGTGALADLLPENVDYIGYDWSEGMLERARIEHPGRGFTSELLPYLVELVACVGPFNLADGWSKEQTWGTLSALWGRTTRALAVCLLSRTDESGLLVYTQGEVSEFAETLGTRFSVSRHLANDLLLVLKR